MFKKLFFALLFSLTSALASGCGPGFQLKNDFSNSGVLDLSSCSPSAKTQGDDQLYTQGKVSLLSHHLERQGSPGGRVKLSSAMEVQLSPTDQLQISPGSDLVVTVDLDCVEALSANPRDSEILRDLLSIQMMQSHPQISELSTQSFPLKVEAETPLEELITQAEADPCLLSLSSDAEVQLLFTPNDPLFSSQPEMASIDLARSREVGFNDQEITREVIVAIIDTGVDYNHPDLAPKMWSGRGYNFLNNNNDPMDSGFHGTHVAGLAAAASNNGIGISGVGTSQIKIMALKVLDENGEGGLSPVINAIRYAIAQGAHVINLSLGTALPSRDLQQALQEAVNAGITVFTASGNDGRSLDNFPVYPASYSDIDGVITVGSVDVATSRRSFFSNFSSTQVQLMAPGSNGNTGVLSTVPTRLSPSGYANRISNNPIQGTSMAAPIAAGAGALVIGYLRSKGQVVTPAMVESILKDSAIKDPQFLTTASEGNRLNLARTAEFVRANLGLQIASQPGDLLVQSDTGLRLEVVMADPQFPFNFQWYRNDQAIPGARSNTLNISSVSEADSGEYRLLVSDSFGRSTESQRFNVFVTMGPLACP